MANIEKRILKNGQEVYDIRVYVGRDINGRTRPICKTFRPALGKSPTQIKKELNKVVKGIELEAMKRQITPDGKMKFEDFANVFMKNKDLKAPTRELYKELLERIIPAIGQIRLDKLNDAHIEAFINNLRENGIKITGKYAVLEEHKLTQRELSDKSGVSTTVIWAAKARKHISIESARKISDSLNKKVTEIFEIHEETGPLSDKSVLHHFRLISSILGYARKKRFITENVAVDIMDAPKVQKKVPYYLSEVEARRFVKCLLEEKDIRIKTAFIILIYTGIRRSELCGLCWPQIDEEKQIINIKFASDDKKELKDPKKNSKRPIDSPQIVFDVLNEYKAWWHKQREVIGSLWQDKDERLFIQDNGKPIYPDTINKWLNKFLKKNDFKHFTPHGLRHTFVALQLFNNVDYKTLQRRGGWSETKTMMDIYAYPIETASLIAKNKIDKVLTP